MKSGKEEVKLNFGKDFGYIAGNKHYMYVNSKSDNTEVNSFVYDMSKQKKVMESKTDTVKCVDDDGRIYCLDSNNSLYVFGTDKKLKGNEIVRKVDDVVYTRDKANRTVLYQYKAGDLVNVITLPSENASFNEDYCWKSESFSQSAIYDRAGNTVVTLPALVLSDADDPSAEYDVKILTVWDKWVLCRFSDAERYSSGDSYVGLFRLGEGGERTTLVAYTSDFKSEYNSEYAQVYRIGNKTYLGIYDGIYSVPEDFLLIQS